VALLIDQHMHSPDAIYVRFFQRPAATTSALAALALRTGAPVVPVFTVPLPNGRFRMIYERPVEPPAPGTPDAVRDFTQRCTDVLEMYVRRQPELWLWMHRRWRDAPAPETRGMFPVVRDGGRMPDARSRGGGGTRLGDARWRCRRWRGAVRAVGAPCRGGSPSVALRDGAGRGRGPLAPRAPLSVRGVAQDAARLAEGFDLACCFRIRSVGVDDRRPASSGGATPRRTRRLLTRCAGRAHCRTDHYLALTAALGCRRCRSVAPIAVPRRRVTPRRPGRHAGRGSW
jgi:hypothetical protein